MELRLHVEPVDENSLSWAEGLTILRGQLTLLRRRCEADLPVGLKSLANAERLARSLKFAEAGS